MLKAPNRLSAGLAFALVLSLNLLPALPSHAEETAECVYSLLRRSTYGAVDDEIDLIVQENGNFFALPRRTPEEASKLNDRVLALLSEEPYPTRLGTGIKSHLTNDELHDLFRKVMENPQVKASCVDGTYNGSKEFGFCWGRAMAVHLKAVQSRLASDSVRKVWAVGALKNGKTSWKYHVTTIIRGENNRWWALDPMFPVPVDVGDWYAMMKELYDNTTHDMRIFATPATRFAPGSAAKYSKGLLDHKTYFGFFSDLLDVISRENTGRGWKQRSGDSRFRRMLERLGIRSTSEPR